MDEKFRKWVAEKALGHDEIITDAQWEIYGLMYLVKAYWNVQGKNEQKEIEKITNNLLEKYNKISLED